MTPCCRKSSLLVLAAREEFFVTSMDYTITANQAAYVLPTRALNGVLREVKLIRGTKVIDLERIDVEDVTDTTSGTPNSFYVEGSNLVLYPTPSSTADTLRIYYFIRPSKLVTNAECAVITAIDTATNTLTVSPPTGWTTADTFDLVKGSAHFDILGMDLAAGTVGASSIVFSATLPTTLAVGDYVSLAGETCFPMLPPEGHVALVQAAVTAALESMGDPSAAVSAQKAAALMGSFQSILKTRIQGAPKALGRRLL
jgi:hypothetical protein